MGLRKLRVFIIFSTTTEALTLEKRFREENLPGRLVPVPRKISESCGMAWTIEVTQREMIEEFLSENSLSYKEIHELSL